MLGGATKYLMDAIKIYPSNNMIWMPTVQIMPIFCLYKILFFFYHLLPAFFIDIILRIIGLKYRLMKIYGKIFHANNLYEIFAQYIWKFSDDNLQELYSKMNEKDLKDFPCISTEDEVEEMIVNAMNGIRKYVLKESDDDLPAARRRLKLFQVAHYVLLMLIYGSLAYWILPKFIKNSGGILKYSDVES